MGKRKITAASKWREPREKGFVVTLPSGHVARIRPVALDVMIQDGSLPDLLSPIAAKALWTETNVEEIANVAEMATGMSELFGVVCKATFIEPRVVNDMEDLDDDEIALADVSFDDKSFVFQLAIQPAQILHKFCEQQARDVELVRDSDGDASEAE